MSARPRTASDAVVELEPLCAFLVRKYFPPPGLDRNDLLQEARVGAFKAWRDYRVDAPSSFRTFANLCIERQIITAIKAATRQKHGALNHAVSTDAQTRDDEDGTLGDLVLLSPAADPERRALDREELMGALEVLRMDVTMLERRAFLAIEIDGASYDEAADALGVDVKQIDNAIQRTRRKLDAHAEGPCCDVCGMTLELGSRCAPCAADLTFASQFVSA